MRALVALLLTAACLLSCEVVSGLGHRHARPAKSVASPREEGPFSWDPIANKAAVVPAINARFTVLTPYIIRCEWSASNLFQDRPTLIAIRRNLPVPKFDVSTNSTHLVIATDFVTLSYNEVLGKQFSFNSSNIQIVARFNTTDQHTGIVAEQSVTWSAINHEEYTGNLFGTIRTLDGDNDANIEFDCQNNESPDQHCTYGVISRADTC